MTDTQTVTNALVRSVDLYVWQDPKLPRFGRFDLTTRWRGRFLRALREAKRLTGDCIGTSITIGIGSFLYAGSNHGEGHEKGATRDP